MGEVDKNLNEGSQKLPDQDCMCFCFCEDPEDNENTEDDNKEGAGDVGSVLFVSWYSFIKILLKKQKIS